MVTGGARGIGRAIAEQMVARGHRVVLTDLDGAAAADTAAEIGAEEGLTHDVRNPAEHRAVAEAALDHGPLVAWFNNAGVGDDGRLAELTEEQVRRLVDVNLLGVLWGMRAAVDAFGPGGGDVVNTASLAGLGPVPGLRRVRRHQGRRRLDHRLGRRRDPAPGALPRGVPGRRRHRDADRGPHPRLARLADRPLRRPGADRRGGRRRRRRRWSARAGWCSASRAGAAAWPAPSAVAPSLSRHAMRLVEAQGRRAIARRAAPLEQLFEQVLDSFEHVL